MGSVVMEEALRRSTLQGVSISGKRLGSGAFGDVSEAYYCGMPCAAKEIHSALLEFTSKTESAKIKSDFVKECFNLSECRHPNIVQFIGIYYREHQQVMPIMIMEKIDCNLKELIERESISFYKALSILHDVSLGMWYMHSRNPPAMHLDLQPNNILVNTLPLIAKICDLGLMKVASGRDLTQVLGSIHFMPPEVLSQNPVYGLPLDVFSFGGVALFTIVGEWPTPSNVQSENISRATKVEVGRRLKYLDKMRWDTGALRLLVEECLDDSPHMRPTMGAVCERIKELKDTVHNPIIEVHVKCMCLH